MKQNNNDDKKKIDEITDQFKNIDLNGKPHCSTLFEAAENGCITSIMQLIHQNHNVNQKDIENTTPLYFAASKGHKDCLAFLIEKKALIDACENNGWTPLMIGIANNNIFNNNYDCVQFLIASKANLEIKNNDDLNALLLATINNQPKLLKLLLENNALINESDRFERTSTMHAARSGYNECLQLLIDYNADIEASNLDGNTALMSATFYNKKECLEIIFNAPFIPLINITMGECFEKMEETALKKELRIIFIQLWIGQKRIRKEKNNLTWIFIPKPLIFRIAKLLVDEPFKQLERMLNAKNKKHKRVIDFAKNENLIKFINETSEMVKKSGAWKEGKSKNFYCSLF